VGREKRSRIFLYTCYVELSALRWQIALQQIALQQWLDRGESKILTNLGISAFLCDPLSDQRDKLEFPKN
jgi:hypothetical protein